MTKEKCRSVLIGTLRDFLGKREADHDIVIHDRTVPIGDLPCFDSLTSLEITVEMERRLEISFPQNELLFINHAENRALCVAEIVDRVHAHASKKGEVQ
ncbi:hypothetical protein HYR69_12335 [Candidatus Sumerlaeota bacterium]|nr:hypothetical protein [Candidatus Sumerlaeota bacterium]